MSPKVLVDYILNHSVVAWQSVFRVLLIVLLPCLSVKFLNLNVNVFLDSFKVLFPLSEIFLRYLKFGMSKQWFLVLSFWVGKSILVQIGIVNVKNEFKFFFPVLLFLVTIQFYRAFERPALILNANWPSSRPIRKVLSQYIQMRWSFSFESLWIFLCLNKEVAIRQLVRACLNLSHDSTQLILLYKQVNQVLWLINLFDTEELVFIFVDSFKNHH